MFGGFGLVASCPRDVSRPAGDMPFTETTPPHAVTSAFVLLFARHEPVPRVLRRAFHVYGVVTAIVAVVTTLSVQAAEACEDSTKALYRFCRVSGYAGIAFTGAASGQSRGGGGGGRTTQCRLLLAATHAIGARLCR